MKSIIYLKKIRFFGLVVLLLALNMACKKVEVLFQEHKTDWLKKGNVNWSFSNNELIGTARDKAGYVITKDTYKDFILELEFKADSTINSGVFLRCNSNDLSPTNCYEVNIWDLHPNQDYRTGAIVLKSKPLAIVETINTWSTYKIKNEKDRIQVWIDGMLTNDIRDTTLTDGYIGLQAKGTGVVSFRNVKIKRLP